LKPGLKYTRKISKNTLKRKAAKHSKCKKLATGYLPFKPLVTMFTDINGFYNAQKSKISGMLKNRYPLLSAVLATTPCRPECITSKRINLGMILTLTNSPYLMVRTWNTTSPYSTHRAELSKQVASLHNATCHANCTPYINIKQIV